MKVYQVFMPYSDGEGRFGHYESPLFTHREDAERFLKAVLEAEGAREWWSADGSDRPQICQLTVFDVWDGELTDSDLYLVL